MYNKKTVKKLGLFRPKINKFNGSLKNIYFSRKTEIKIAYTAILEKNLKKV